MPYVVDQHLKSPGLQTINERNIVWISEIGLASGMTTPQFELEVKGRLPPGWSCHISKSTGKNYYFNNQTGASVWDIKELPPTVAPQITQADSPDPEDFSIEEELQSLMEQQEALKKEISNKMSGGAEDRLPSPDLDCDPISDTSLDGLRSGIGSRLRRKVNWCHDQNLAKIETASKKLKVASPVSISTKVDINAEEINIETEENSNPVELNVTASSIRSDDEDEDSLFGADPEELEALSKLSEKY